MAHFAIARAGEGEGSRGYARLIFRFPESTSEHRAGIELQVDPNSIAPVRRGGSKLIRATFAQGRREGERERDGREKRDVSSRRAGRAVADKFIRGQSGRLRTIHYR